MKTFYSISLVVSTILGVTTYVALNNYLYTLVVVVVSLIYFILIGQNLMKRYFFKIDRFHELYHFINNYLVSLNVYKTTNAAFITAFESINYSSNEELVAINNLEDRDKFHYLKKYFRFHLYQLFVDLIELYNDEGGDILIMSQNLSNQLREVEDYIAFSEGVAKRRVFEFSLLWFFALIIVVVLRLSLADFYQSFVHQYIFIGGVLLMMLLVIVSVHILLVRMTNVEIKGWKDEK